MIKGIGVDVIEIERVRAAIGRIGPSFIDRLFTLNEQIPFESPHIATHYAGRFAAKEAIVKALGTGFRGIGWKDIEIRNDTLGKPLVHLSPKMLERFGNPELLLTISHSKTTACAFCLWQE